jgi:CRISPR-associated protein Csm2
MQNRYDRNRKPERRDQAPQFQGPSEVELQKILLESDANLLVAWAEKIGREIANENLSTNQLRNVFGTVRQIQMRWKKGNEANAWREIVLLRPKMTYFAKRAADGKGEKSSPGLKTLQSVIEPAINLLDKSHPHPTDEQFRNFTDFFEAIVAYHTRYARK